MNPLPLVLSIALLTGCATPARKTAGGWQEATTKQEAAAMAAEEAQEQAERRAYAGTQVPMTWAPWWGPNACAQRTW